MKKHISLILLGTLLALTSCGPKTSSSAASSSGKESTSVQPSTSSSSSKESTPSVSESSSSEETKSETSSTEQESSEVSSEVKSSSSSETSSESSIEPTSSESSSSESTSSESSSESTTSSESSDQTSSSTSTESSSTDQTSSKSSSESSSSESSSESTSSDKTSSEETSSGTSSESTSGDSTSSEESEPSYELNPTTDMTAESTVVTENSTLSEAVYKFNKDFTINGFTFINGTKNWLLDTSSKTINGENFTGRLKSNGKGSKKERAISFEAKSSGTLVVYGSSSSGNKTVTGVVENEDSNISKTSSVFNGTAAAGTIDVSAGTNYFYPSDNNMYIFYLKFTPAA